MNALTRDALITLVDEASDEQILKALSEPTTSVLLFRFLLKQYMISFTSIPGNKIDHQNILFKWSKIFGYIELEEKRKCKTISADDSNVMTSNDSETESENEEIIIPNINIQRGSINKKLPIRNSIKNERTIDGNLFRLQTDTIAEDTEEKEYEYNINNNNNYNNIISPPITPPMNTSSSMNNINYDINKKSIELSTNITKPSNEYYDYDYEYYDLSDDNNEEFGFDDFNFKITLFFKIWLNIVSYLNQNDKLLSLQFVSKKFRTVALSKNHWKNMNIKLPMIYTINKKFLISINKSIECITIIQNCNSNNLAKNDYEFIHYLPENIHKIIICNKINTINTQIDRQLLVLLYEHIISCDELIIYGVIYNINLLSNILYKYRYNLNVLYFNLENAQQKEEIILPINNKIKQLVIPNYLKVNWLMDCIKNNKLTFIEVIESYQYHHQVNNNIYNLYCFEYDILKLIADNCHNIKHISIHCKLQNEFANTFKYLLLKCKELNYIRLQFNIASHIMTENHFLPEFTQLKINCLNILQEYKYHCTSTSHCYNSYNNLSILDHDSSCYDLEFTLFK